MIHLHSCFEQFALKGLEALMAYFHQRRRIRRRIPVQRVSLMATLYYAEIFPLVRIRRRIPVRRFCLVATVPIFGMEICPNKPVYTVFSCVCLHSLPFSIEKVCLQKWRGAEF